MGEPEPERIGRLRAAWQALMGRPVLHEQARREWFEYKQMFDDIMQRLGAQLARQAKQQKVELQRLIDDAGEPPVRDVPGGASSRKADLRRRAAEMRGIRVPKALRVVNGEDEA